MKSLKDIFLDVQKNYNALHKKVVEGLDNLDKSRGKFVSVINTSNKISKKINATAKSLGFSKVDVNKNIEKKMAKLEGIYDDSDSAEEFAEENE
ncbi:hypothetical protein HYE36_06850 [Mycoplasmopsis bovis]|nr:hypothetical protein [Mycoplasmopsis bovis]WHL49799.1 hypothetical protein HYE36_06850 [Mycoplasmopsis bovis]